MARRRYPVFSDGRRASGSQLPRVGTVNTEFPASPALTTHEHMRCAAEAVARVSRFTRAVQARPRTRAHRLTPRAEASTETGGSPEGTMLLLGLTGSIGMGKSAVSSMLTEKLRVPVLDSDAVVHEIYSPGGDAVEPRRPGTERR